MTAEITQGDTIRRLAEMTDEGLFERLATAVLRETDPAYRLLSHPGVNAAGKTVKSPLDGITFVPGTNPPHMIAVHHTITERDSLENKWLHDPARVIPRKGAKPAAPPGDLIKTVRIFEDQRQTMGGLRATLILTTNHDPSEELVRNVNAQASLAGIEVKIYPGSALAHYLDIEPNGQWIRKHHLGIEQERLSGDLLSELSRRSIENHHPRDDKSLWVERELDRTLGRHSRDSVLFVVGDSGTGKSIACYKRLMRHVETGGYGLVLPHEAVAGALSLDHAIEITLRQLHPALAPGSGSAARALASESMPLLVVVEDVNKSGQAVALIEKLTAWAARSGSQAETSRLLCPVWPRILAALGDEMRNHIATLSISATSFTATEGASAVQRRQNVGGRSLTPFEAATISRTLGHDPLLIALHDATQSPDPQAVIGQFIEGSLGRLAAARGEFTSAECGNALRRLAAAMLDRRCLDLTMPDVSEWFGSSPDTPTMIRHAASFGEVMHVTGAASTEKLVFRHDRVRDHLLADAAADLMRRDAIPAAILAEPFFAEILGAALARTDIPASVIEQLRASNPLALVCALRVIGELSTDFHKTILGAVENWLDLEASRAPEDSYLCWEAQRVLSDIEAPYVIGLARRFFRASDAWFALRARFRNGDVAAGIGLCARTEPGVTVAGHLELIHYVQDRYADRLITELDQVLRGNAPFHASHAGALRLAGHLADKRLAGAVAASWKADPERDRDLREYLWAAARCCDDPARVLIDVCDAWAALPDEKDEKTGTTPRNELAAHNVRWAIRDKLPEPALRYFIERAKAPDLRWPITYMLHGFDHPDAVEFVARDLAATAESLEGTQGISPFSISIRDEWTRRQERTGVEMSAASKDRLHALWKDETQGKHLRMQAFRLWSSSIAPRDLALLRSIDETDLLADLALRERLRRGDRSANAALISKIRQDTRDFWWHSSRHTWTAELTELLDEELGKRGARVERRWDFKDEHSKDWITSELVTRLPQRQGEALLHKHWEHLRFSPLFLQSALYVATPSLAKAVAESVAACPAPKDLFKHVTRHFGFKTIGHPGIIHVRQVEGLLPYFEHLDDLDISHLWDACNEHGWFDLRRKNFDARLNPKWRAARYMDAASAMAELDRLTANDQPYWGDHWADQLAKAGLSADQIIEILGAWLEKQHSIEALELASTIVIHAGRRAHLSLLTNHSIGTPEQAARIAENASFAVKRRSLS